MELSDACISLADIMKSKSKVSEQVLKGMAICVVDMG